MAIELLLEASTTSILSIVAILDGKTVTVLCLLQLLLLKTDTVYVPGSLTSIEEVVSVVDQE
tara:strand:+ start:55 stop:240 length:186 start_codon:yes stop_codon:yes gene_type:complete